MSRSASPPPDAVVPPELLERHLRDVPSAEDERRLLALLQRDDAPATDAPAEPFDSEPLRDASSSRRHPTSASRRRTPWAVASLAAAVCAAWLVWRPGASPTVSKEPSARLSAPVAPAVQPCFAAGGTDGTLWPSGLPTPNAPSVDGRSGLWLHSWGGAVPGAPHPAEVLPTAAGDRFALRAAGPSVSGWGAKLSVALRARAGSTLGHAVMDCYDASAYDGIRFRASGKGIVFVLLQTPSSVPPELGGTCQDKCWYTASHAVALKEQPQDFVLPWSLFAREGDAQPIQSRLMFVELFLQQQAEPYELTVESVELAKRGAP